MKYIKIVSIVIVLFLMSCTEVVSVEVPYEGPRLVIEASLDWQKGTLGNEQTIKLSLSSPYFNDTSDINWVKGASVQVTNNNDGTVFVFNNQNNGKYTTTSFVPVLNDVYTLKIIYEGETYIGEETLLPLSGINKIEQSLLGGIDPELIDIEVFFDDPVDEENYYLIIYFEQGDMFPFLGSKSDEFRNGNTISDIIEKSEDEEINQKPFDKGDVIDIKLLSISKSYHEYISLVIAQSQSGNNPFGAVPVSIKGNCVNITNTDNSPFGYFRVAELDEVRYTVE